MPPEVLDSCPVFRGKVFSVRRDRIRLASGKEAQLEVIDHPASVTVIPSDGRGGIWFVRQYRHPTRGELLELPAGTLNPGEEPLECARRECREEVGLAPGRLTLLGECWLAPGYATEYMYFYLAEDLAASPLAPDEDEELQPLRLTREEAAALAARGEIRDAKTIVGLHLLSLQVPGS
jgi:ADP-ribose pyrophosphatase